MIVALILQVFYNYILAKIEALTSEMEDSSISLLDMVIKYDLKYKNIKMAKLSYKVSYYALYVMFAIILVVLGMFFFGGDAQGDAVLASVDAEMWQPAHTDALIY